MSDTKFYIDDQNPANYMNGWTEGHIDIDPDWIEIDAPPPVHASQTTTDGGSTWSTYTPP